DLTGITNQNAFYADYYLHSLLKRDLDDWVKTSRASGQTFWTPLRELSRIYRQVREDFAAALTAAQQLALQRAFLRQLLNALDYTTRPDTEELDRGPLPLMARIDQDQQPYLWVVEAFGEDEDVMTLPVHAAQTELQVTAARLSQLIDEAFFQRTPPRWMLVVSLDQLLLLDRTKWAGQQALRFDWSVLYAERDTPVAVFQLIAMLLSRPALVPGGGDAPMADVLAKKSWAHNQGISGSLKYALRRSVELLGQEYIRLYPDADCEAVTNECLRYLYRLLFLFTVEARQQLGYLPMNALLYREGFSLEKLRDLEFAPLHEENASEGFFIHDSLMELFDLVYQGRSEAERQRSVVGGLDTFSVAPLKCDLFDIEHTPLLASIKVRNVTWQKILRSLSISRTARGQGRISYAQLGINHLGEVYEALLSYAGFVAYDTLYEVRPKGQTYDLLKAAYFVTREELETHYTEDERVYRDDGSIVVHPKGRFIYRLTGRAKETSASYYTPEPLTRCVVRYALQEAMAGRSADELLQLTICEPAMGSAAFLNEAVSQLAEAYMLRKTKERAEILPPEVYARHLQRVKLYLADNNVYGVDLNPIAVELGGVSLWLNTLVPGGFVPWFGNQLSCGNALVGTWRRVYAAHTVRKGKWWQQAAQDVTTAGPGQVYHFLLGDPGMAHYTSKVVKSLAGPDLQRIRRWKRSFTKPLTEDEALRLAYLSRQIDGLWAKHVRSLERLEKATTDPFPIYPAKIPDPVPEVVAPVFEDEIYGQRAAPLPLQHYETAATSTRYKDGLMREVLAEAAYRRLKLVMDYWCALWYWPMNKAALLPTRAAYISDLGAILAGRQEAVQGELSAEPDRDVSGDTDLDELIHRNPRLQVASDLARKERFHHWQLTFADRFAHQGGFDVVIGNPPWLKSQFVEKAVMGDLDARFAVKKLSAPQTAVMRTDWIENDAHRRHYTKHYESALGQINFQNAAQNYPLLKGMQANVYKSFITVAWALSTGSVGLLHPGGVYDDPKGARLRAALYPRLRYRFQFRNALFLFPDVHDQTSFSVNVYGPPQENPSFVAMANLFDSRTVDASFAHDGYGPIPRIKTDKNKWDLTGHKDRLIRVTKEDLKIYAALYDQPGTPYTQAKLPGLHCTPLKEAVRTLARVPQRIGDFKDRYYATRMWDETNAVKDGTIRRETRFTEGALILSGPHIFVGHPYFKTPNRECRFNSHYTRLDLMTLPTDYRPRTNYVPACEDYEARIPVTPWGTKATEGFRIAMRRMFGAASERSCIAAVVPPGVGHVHPVICAGFQNVSDLMQIMQGFATTLYDFLAKVSGKVEMNENLWERFPVVPLDSSAAARIFGLSCLTRDYAALWEDPDIPRNSLGWSRRDHRLDPAFFDGLEKPWSRHSPLRTDYARWQAQIELDVLFAQACGLTLEQLCIIYRMQFPVLQNYEKDTWYDQTGRVVFASKSGEGMLPRTAKTKDTSYSLETPKGHRENIALGWKDVKDLRDGSVSYTFTDDTLPGGPTEKTITCHAPF
ncbi:MAG: hypothetical protein OXP68_02130, partial [Anaerolineaceae bacterium]|nr:hypothetical protein [Anaerolineaceae bacterium]